MARIRSVHPGLWTDEAFVSVSALARILFIGIWTESDDVGCFEWKPNTLKMRVLPVDNADVAALMDELASANMVMHYAINGRNYGAIRNFCRFQRPKKPKSTYPTTPEVLLFVASNTRSSEPDDDEGSDGSPPPKSEAPPVPKKSELPTYVNGPVPQKTEIAPQMEETLGNKRKEDRSLRSLARSRAAKADPEFAEFYAAYPRHRGPDDALKAWRAVRNRGVTAAEILAGLAQHQFTDDPEFIPYPATWLRDGCWKDEPTPVRTAAPAAKPSRLQRENDAIMAWVNGGTLQ